MVFISKSYLLETILLFYLTATSYGVEKDYGANHGSVSLKVSGIKNSKGPTTVNAESFTIEEPISFGNNLKLKNLNVFRVKMDDFTNQEGVKVTLIVGESSMTYATIFSSDRDNGIKSEPIKTFEIKCHLFVCEGGIVILSKKKFSSENDVTADDVPFAFYVSYYSKSTYIAKELGSNDGTPTAYECPKQSWVQAKSGIKFSHDISSAIIGENEIEHDGKDQNEYKKAFKKVFISPVVSDEKNSIKTCNQITMKQNTVLKWGYKIVSSSATEIPRYDLITEGDDVKSLDCGGQSITELNGDSHLFITYIPDKSLGKGKQRFRYGSIKPEKYYYNSKILVYKFFDTKNPRYNGSLIAPSQPIPLVCYYEIKNTNGEAKYNVILETKARLGPDHTLPNQIHAKYIVVEEDAFSSNAEKTIDLKCKGSTFISNSSDGGKFSNYYDQFASPKFVKLEGPSDLDKVIGSPVETTILTIKKNSFDHYGIYKCIPGDNIDHNILNKQDYFIILPQEGMNFKRSVEVTHQGKINSNCPMEYPKLAKLKEISMQYDGKMTKADVTNLNSHEHFSFNQDKSYVEFKTILHKGDVLTCTYETVYKTTFITTITFDSDEDFIKSAAGKKSFFTDNKTFIIVAGSSIGIIIFAAFIAFTIVRIRRQRRRKLASSLSGTSGLSGSKSKSKSSSSVSKNKSSASRSKTSNSRSKSQSKSRQNSSKSKSTSVKPAVTLSAR